MTVPPFPSQDLAKLVLGYLAEEQLMTAYDEFLQASPYLDALENEYDRIFMTSLRNILAEYRAVKIIVETCKPCLLRRKLFQCANLLEMIKYLIQNVDLNKIQEANNTKISLTKSSSTVNDTCEVCRSLKQDVCTCRSKQLHTSSVQAETKSLENSLETTALSDLPGNLVTNRKKNSKGHDNEVIDLNVSCERKESSSDDDVVEILPKNISTFNSSTQNNNLTVKTSDPSEHRQNEEFTTTVLHQVCNKDQNTIVSNLNAEPVSKRLSVGGYNDFATGVKGDGGNINVPDSSTSENLHLQNIGTKECNIMPDLNPNIRPKPIRTQYLLKVANVKSTGKNEIVSINTINQCSFPNLKPKPEDNKIKIISDVKVDNSFNNETHIALKKPAVLKNATSTPLLQMQTIVINGTPVYKHQPIVQSQNYTKDEIMAMPTIILAPVTGVPHIPPSTKTTVSTSYIKQSHSSTTTSTSAQQFGPLVIDVASRSTTITHKTSNQISCVENNNEGADTNLPKNLDVISASAPKDNTVVGISETSTPQILPPLRKSSSTPRRTSHIRVLDFATPRRILHECVPNTTTNDVEVVISKSPSLNIPFVTDRDVNDALEPKVSSKENSVITKVFSKTNWDADLRALAVIPEKNIEADDTPSTKTKSKPKLNRKRTSKKESEKKENDSKVEEKSVSKKKTTKVKASKKNINIEEFSEINACETVDVPKIKPTINIISGTDRSLSTSDDKVQSKLKSDNADTPEMERLSLQNDIGAKLNISDILGTPYKQALYDIQMETPRFLGPDIPDVDPMSDIKIMNIPTPRFLNTAATPSSYSPRPTDYSSGGSYYKPDDQDYMHIDDDVICPVSSTKDTQNTDVSSSDKFENNEKSEEKPTRPVRQCTKNVSYYNINNKTKELEDKDTIEIPSSETENESFNEVTVEMEKTPNVKDVKTKTSGGKADLKRGRTKKQKTPIKKESKSFIKIKPRRPTPTKTKDSGKKSRKSAEYSKVQTRKKAAAALKERNVKSTPVVTAAPTKSRRKSSTPRKLHCSKSYHSESSGHNSPELMLKTKEKLPESNLACTQDSDTEQLPLRWSDDGSQDAKPKETKINVIESEDISKIQEYINSTLLCNSATVDSGGGLHIDLVKRGFDVETAKIIERDLLDTPQHSTIETEVKKGLIVTSNAVVLESKVVAIETKPEHTVLDNILESGGSASKNLQIVRDDESDDGDEIELSVHECSESDTNYITCIHDETKDLPRSEPVKLKDKFSMEVCLDDDLSIRLRATPFHLILDQDPHNVSFSYNYKETEIAVSSISNIEKLYTPLKDSVKAQCYDIFDSTLTSLDTPLKENSPKRKEAEISVTEIVLEVEKVEDNEKIDPKKRKRVQSGNMSDECLNKSKKAKPDAPYLFNSKNIQNMDIDSVLSKLHGP